MNNINLKVSVAAAVLAFASGAAFATQKTCAEGGMCPEYPETPVAPPVSQTQQQQQQQAQQQAQLQAQQQKAEADARAAATANANANNKNTVSNTVANSVNTSLQGGDQNTSVKVGDQNTTVGGQTTTVGGQSTNVGGQTATTGSQNVSFNYSNPRQAAQVGTIQLVGGGACPEGWGLGLSLPSGGATFSKTNQSRICLSQAAAVAIMNAGVARGDDLTIAGGIASLANIHTEIDEAIERVYGNTMKECSAKALAISPILMARRGAAVKDAEGNVTGHAGIDCAEVNAIFKNYASPAAPVAAAAVAQANPGYATQKLENITYIFVDETKKTAAATPRKASAPKTDCTSVIIPAAERQVCVNPKVAADNVGKGLWKLAPSK